MKAETLQSSSFVFLFTSIEQIEDMILLLKLSFMFFSCKILEHDS